MAREMKDSGVAWIGKMPSSWSILALKYLCNMQAGKNLTSEQIIPEGSYPVYGGNGQRGFYNSFNCDGARLLIGRQGALSGNIHKASGKFWATEHAVITKPSKLASIDFLYYLLIGMDLNQYVSSTAAQPGLAVNTIMNIKTCLPDLYEQREISNHLDRKCAEIDGIYEKTCLSVKEYKKLKQTVITQAVTKGIRGDRPMKDSGTAWEKKVPCDWDVYKTLYCLDMPITDGPHSTPEFYDEGIPFVSAEAVSCGNGDIDFNFIRGYISQEFYEECCRKYIPQVDDIYMIKSGATTGKVSIVKTDRIFAIWSPLAVFRCNRKRMLPKFLFYFLQSSVYH